MPLLFSDCHHKCPHLLPLTPMQAHAALCSRYDFVNLCFKKDETILYFLQQKKKTKCIVCFKSVGIESNIVKSLGWRQTSL